MTKKQIAASRNRISASAPDQNPDSRGHLLAAKRAVAPDIRHALSAAGTGPRRGARLLSPALHEEPQHSTDRAGWKQYYEHSHTEQ
jgi:hypothetical protein